jgi:hypothetical protein
MSCIYYTKADFKVTLHLYNYLYMKLFCSSRKLYLMEPLCQTQMPAGGHDSSELLNQLETQEAKILECEQRCRKTLSDLQKVKKRFYISFV